MKTFQKPVQLKSLGDDLSGNLFLPETESPAPVLIICHGAGEYKENYFELSEELSRRGIAALALDMHGHGESAGTRFHVDMNQWVADIRAGVDFLIQYPGIDENRIGAFGLSSGGTAILEAALVEPRLKALITLDATVRNSLPLAASICLKTLVALGRIKKWLMRDDLRVSLAQIGKRVTFASDPDVNRRLHSDPRSMAAFTSFPFPGASQAFFVDTLRRVSGIKAPTLILWGEDDKLDPPETARLLYDALACEKQLHIIPGNGHVGHLDRNRYMVFALTADWALQKLGSLW